MPRHRRLPNSILRPASCPNTSFMRNGTPRNGPGPRARSSRPPIRSEYVSTTALSAGLMASIAAAAVVASSFGETSFFATSSASPRASYAAYSASFMGHLKRVVCRSWHAASRDDPEIRLAGFAHERYPASEFEPEEYDIGCHCDVRARGLRDGSCRIHDTEPPIRRICHVLVPRMVNSGRRSPAGGDSMKRLAVAITLFFALSGWAFAQTGDPARGSTLYHTTYRCTDCHGDPPNPVLLGDKFLLANGTTAQGILDSINNAPEMLKYATTLGQNQQDLAD